MNHNDKTLFSVHSIDNLFAYCEKRAVFIHFYLKTNETGPTNMYLHVTEIWSYSSKVHIQTVEEKLYIYNRDHGRINT